MAPRAHVINRVADQLVAGRVGETVRLSLVAQDAVDMRGLVPELVAAVRGRGCEVTFSRAEQDAEGRGVRVFEFVPEREDEALFFGSDRPDWPTIVIDVTGPDTLDLVRIGGPAGAEVHLFSYGTLQQAAVQRSTFGRELDGASDALPGHSLDWITVVDAAVVETSGSDRHPIVSPSTDPADAVPGTVFTLTTEELAASDLYEVGEYRRVAVRLSSGTPAWVYLSA